MAKTSIYAAYGSNMNLGQMAKRCPAAKVCGKGVLKGYRLTFRGLYRGVANIEKKKGRSVPIVLWLITEECEKELDRYEGYPLLYTKTSIKVHTDKEVVTAMAYVMTPKYSGTSAKSSESYFETIKEGYADNNIDIEPLTEAYAECLKELGETGSF